MKAAAANEKPYNHDNTTLEAIREHNWPSQCDSDSGLSEDVNAQNEKSTTDDDVLLCNRQRDSTQKDKTKANADDSENREHVAEKKQHMKN